MKKKLRGIIVENKRYLWLVKSMVDESEIPYSQIKIWRGGEAAAPIITKDEEGAITPHIIASLITKYENSL